MQLDLDQIIFINSKQLSNREHLQQQYTAM
jgi:hypothetical protein